MREMLGAVPKMGGKMGEVLVAAPRGKKTRLSLLQQRFWGSGNAKKNERLQRLRGCRTGMPGACPGVLGEYVRGGARADA